MQQRRGVSINGVIEDLAIRELTEFDPEMRFQTRAARGDTGMALRLWNRLDREEAGDGPR